MTVRSLQHVALAVPDTAVRRAFYQAFGLEAREEGRRIVMRCHGRDQDQVVLLEVPSRKLHHLCFGTRADLLPGLKRRIEDAGGRLLDPPREHPASIGRSISIPACWACASRTVRRTSSHSCIARAAATIMSLHSSNRTGRDTTTPASRWRTSTRSGWAGAARLLDKGYGYGWGLGRHVLGSNVFFYIRDPWHDLAEYFCDIDYIPAGMNWEAQDWPPQDAFYAWGPSVPEDFGKNFEAGN
jgi:catechol 2,3-dioxygenase-like lactoylglutathione lyase family enzyme